MENTYTHAASTSNLAHYVSENQDLRERLRLSEKQLNDARDKIVILAKKNTEAERGIDVSLDHFSSFF